MEETIIKLQYPVKIKNEGGGEVVYSELTLRRIKVKDLKKLPEDVFQSVTNGEGSEQLAKGMSPVKLVPFLASLSGVEEHVFEEIDFEDLSAIADKFGEIVGKLKSMETGKG